MSRICNITIAEGEEEDLAEDKDGLSTRDAQRVASVMAKLTKIWSISLPVLHPASDKP